MSSTPEFPAPFRRNGRLFWPRHEIENYKRGLIGLAPLAPDPQAPIIFVTAKQLTAELPFGRRQIGRLVKGREQHVEEAV
jgi:hypothetical protein